MDYDKICRAAQDLGATLLPGEPLVAGDSYFAHRNGPVALLTVLEIKDGYVIPVEVGYSYDLHECVKTTLGE